MVSGGSSRRAWPAAVLVVALAMAAMAWWTGMAHPSYIRQVLLTALLAPAALAVGLVASGPTVRGLKLALSGRPARVFLAAVWFHALLAWASLSWTGNVGITVDRAVVLTTLAVWGTGWLLAAPGSWSALASGHLAVMGAMAALGALCHLGAIVAGDAPARLSAPIGNANTVAVLMIFPLCAAAALAVTELRSPRAWPWPGYGVLAAGVFAAASFAFAGSRSGIVGLGVALAGLTWIMAPVVANGRMRPLPARLAAFGAGLLAAGALAGVLYFRDPAGFRARWAPLLQWEKAQTSSVGARFFGARAALGIFLEHPVGGAGAGTYMPEASRHIPRERYLGSYGRSFLNVAHNEYAETAAELGGLGLVAFLAVLASAFVGAWRAAGKGEPGTGRALAAGLAASIAGVAVSSLGDPSFRYWDFTGIFYAAAALAASAGRPGSESAGGEGAADGPQFRTSGMLAFMGCIFLAAAATALWSSPDALREMSWKEARRAADQAARCRQWAAAEYRAGHAGEAERLTSEAGRMHARAAGRYFTAVRTPGYFLSRALAHYEWIEEMALAGRKDEALKLAEEFSRMMPDSPQALRCLAKARYGCRLRAEALDALIRSGRLDPYTGELCDLLPKFFTHDPEADARLVDEVRARLGLSSAEVAILRSAAAAGRGDWPGAAAACDGVDPTEESFVAPGYWRGRVLLRAGRSREAVETLERYLAGTKIHADGYWLLAQAHAAAAGRPGTDEEINALRRCESLDVEHEQAALRLVDVLVGLGRLDEALKTSLRHLPIARGGRTDFALKAAEIYDRQGRSEEAARLLRSEIRRYPDGKAPAEIVTMLDRLLGAAPGAGSGGLPEEGGKSDGVRGKVELPAE